MENPVGLMQQCFQESENINSNIINYGSPRIARTTPKENDIINIQRLV